MKTVQNGDSVKVNYTGRLEDGSVFDSSLTEGREPLAAILGNGQLIKGFESGLMGMSIGDKKTIEIEPVDAYGEVIEGLDIIDLIAAVKTAPGDRPVQDVKIVKAVIVQ